MTSPWAKRKKITIDSTLVPSNQTNIPIPVVLNDADIAAAAQADGDDIAFFASDGTTQLPYARISYASGALVAKVRLGTILGASDTDFYVYYGDAGAADQQDRANCFSNGYTAFWAMDEDPSGTPPQMVDYTGNGHNGTSAGSMTNTDEIAAKIGNGYAFDGVNDGFTVGTLGTFGSQMDTIQVTCSFWLRTTDTDEIYLIGGGKAFPNSFFQVGINSDVEGNINTGWINFYGRSEGSTTELAAHVAANTGITDGNWHKIDIVVNKASNTVTFYVDASAQTTTYSRQETPGTSANFTQFGVGAAYNTDTAALFGFGTLDMDETSLALAGRSADWITTMYNAENNNGVFLTVGAEEDLGVGTLSAILGALTLDSAAELDLAATATPTLGALTSTATGELDIVGSATPTLGAVTLDATGQGEAITGSTDATLAALTSAATGEIDIEGSAAPTLEALTSTAEGNLATEGAATPTLGALTSAAVGELALIGNVAATLEAATLAAVGVGEAREGTLDATLAPLTLFARETAGAASAARSLDSLLDLTHIHTVLR